MIDVVFSILDITIGSLEKLSNLIKSQKKSNKEELCYALYRFYEIVEKIIIVSERLLAKLPDIENEGVRDVVCKDQEEIANLITKTWRPTLILTRYMEIADPKIAESIHQAFGEKLTLLNFLSTVSPILTQESKKRTLKMLKKVDFNVLQTKYHHVRHHSLTNIAELQKTGIIDIETIDREHIDLILKRGHSNVNKLKKLRSKIREFMIANFEKEDFFFSKVWA